MTQVTNLIKFDKNLYSTSVRPLWCPGCGDFSLLKSLKNTLYKLQIDPSQTLLVAGIGCSSKMNDAVGTYGLHTIHGRALPAAIGSKLSNYDLNVIVYGGDGDMTGIGNGHFNHACRRNIDMTLIIANNKNYGLTTGQASPTSDIGYKSKTSPKGVVDTPINPVLTAIASGATFVARTSSTDAKHLQFIIEEAIKHKGFAVIDFLQFCISFNRINTPDYYKPRLFNLQDVGHNYTNKADALRMAELWGDRIPYGIFYKIEKPDYKQLYPQLGNGGIATKRTKKIRDVSSLFKDLM